MHSDQLANVALTFETRDETIEAELKALLPDADFSVADNFSGEISIAALLAVGKDVLASILGFLSVKQKAVSSAKIVIKTAKGNEKKEIELSGYSAAQAGDLLDKIKELEQS